MKTQSKNKRNLTITLCCIAILLLLLIIWIAWANTALELNTYHISGKNIPESFSGYRIAHVSDLHNAEMGEDNTKLLTMLQEANPDIIVITGDIVDSYNTDIDIALDFAEKAVNIAPCFYVTGNHEARLSSSLEILLDGLEEAGVVILGNEKLIIEQSGEMITLLGVSDPSFQADYLFGDAENVISGNLEYLMDEEENYCILLSHRPELFDVYVEYDIDLVLSGHAHGGQFRLPIIGGLAAPNQGLFPKYDSGLYHEEDTNMIVSRGIGNSIFPFRLNNRPEVIVIELQHEQ